MRRPSRALTSPGPATLLLLALGPDDEPPWVRLYGQPMAGGWAAAILAEDAPARGGQPAEPGPLRGHA